MLPWETLRARAERRARRRTDLAALEQLEGRQLLSYSSLGYSLPDLRISGLAGPVASWGSTYQVTFRLTQRPCIIPHRVDLTAIRTDVSSRLFVLGVKSLTSRLLDNQNGELTPTSRGQQDET